MFVQSRWFRWTRNGLAVVGLLGTTLFGGLILAFWWQEAEYEARAAQVEAKPEPVSLQTAATLIYQAGLVGNADKRLLAGINDHSNEGRHVEAYCIEAGGAAPSTEWVATTALDPLLAKAAAAALDKAHAALPCVPGASEVAGRGLPVKLIEANFQSDHAGEVRVAARDPSSGSYFLVYVSNSRNP